MSRSRVQRVRLGYAIVILILLSPVAVSGLQYSDGTALAEEEPVKNITFISTQGKFLGTSGGQVVAIKTSDKTPVWRHDGYETYYDIDPLGDDRVLYVAGGEGTDASTDMVAEVRNWRTGELILQFEVPWDTHDVDYLGDGKYVVADKYNHRIYIHDAGTGEETWGYDFIDHYPDYPGAGDSPHGDGGEYTHLNDVDSVWNGTAFLASPRNFDRVMAINRTTKETELVLGVQDNKTILDRQHNPVLLSMDPPTLLVADSSNWRVVEYELTDGEWVKTWEYADDLHWPRDADRLPNGNTLITDTKNQRVLEVTPGKEVVWSHDIRSMPYDIERLKYGDEPAGPTMSGYEGTIGNGGESAESGEIGTWERLYNESLWVLPNWVTPTDFSLLVGAVGVLVLWLSTEVYWSIVGEGSPHVQTS